MASDVLSLFGGQTPQQLRGAALDSMMVSPAQMGSQSLLQQVVSMGQNAGTMLGMGAGQLLGGKVAGEVEAAYLDDAIQMANRMGGTPSEKMRAVANSLADKPGMGRQYMMALQEADRLEASDLALKEAKFKEKNRTRTIDVTIDATDSLGQPIKKPAKLTQEQIGTDANGKAIWRTVSLVPVEEEGTSGKGDNNKPQTDKEKALAALRKQQQAKVGMGKDSKDPMGQSEAETNRLLAKPKPPKRQTRPTPGGGGGLIVPEEFR